MEVLLMRIPQTDLLISFRLRRAGLPRLEQLPDLVAIAQVHVGAVLPLTHFPLELIPGVLDGQINSTDGLHRRILHLIRLHRFPRITEMRSKFIQKGIAGGPG